MKRRGERVFLWSGCPEIRRAAALGGEIQGAGQLSGFAAVVSGLGGAGEVVASAFPRVRTAVAELLAAKGAGVAYHAPFIPSVSVRRETLESIEDVEAAAAESDLLVVLVPHSGYDLPRLASLAPTTLNTSSVPLEAETL